MIGRTTVVRKSVGKSVVRAGRYLEKVQEDHGRRGGPRATEVWIGDV
jgi:hypothetical protein